MSGRTGNVCGGVQDRISNLVTSHPVQLDFRTPPGFDRTRNAEIGNKDIKLKHLEEAFTSEHWLVRIYKVKKLENRDRVENKLRGTDSTRQKYTSKKVSRPLPKGSCVWEQNAGFNHQTPGSVCPQTAKRKRGYVKNKLSLKKGKKLSKKSL